MGRGWGGSDGCVCARGGQLQKTLFYDPPAGNQINFTAVWDPATCSGANGSLKTLICAVWRRISAESFEPEMCGNISGVLADGAGATGTQPRDDRQPQLRLNPLFS